jgi:hypothetical protein
MFVLPVKNKLALFLDQFLRSAGEFMLEPGIPKRFLTVGKLGNIIASECVPIRISVTWQSIRKPVEGDRSQDVVYI